MHLSSGLSGFPNQALITSPHGNAVRVMKEMGEARTLYFKVECATGFTCHRPIRLVVIVVVL